MDPLAKKIAEDAAIAELDKKSAEVPFTDMSSGRQDPVADAVASDTTQIPSEDAPTQAAADQAAGEERVASLDADKRHIKESEEDTTTDIPVEESNPSASGIPAEGGVGNGTVNLHKEPKKGRGGPARNVSGKLDLKIGDPEQSARDIANAEATQKRALEAQAEFNELVQNDPKLMQMQEVFTDLFGREAGTEAIREVIPEIRRKTQELDQQLEEIMGNEVDPTRLFNNGAGVGAAFAVAAGTLSQAILGPGSANAALQIVQTALDRDLKAQVVNQKVKLQASQSRRALLDTIRGTLNDERAVESSMRAAYQSIGTTMLQQHRMKLDKFAGSAAFDQIIGAMEAKKSEAIRNSRTHIVGNLVGQSYTKSTAAQTGRLGNQIANSVASSFTPSGALPGETPAPARAPKRRASGGGRKLDRNAVANSGLDKGQGKASGKASMDSILNAQVEAGMTDGAKSNAYNQRGRGITFIDATAANAVASDPKKNAKFQQWVVATEGQRDTNRNVIELQEEMKGLIKEMGGFELVGEGVLTAKALSSPEGAALTERISKIRTMASTLITDMTKNSGESLGRMTDKDIDIITKQYLGALKLDSEGAFSQVSRAGLRGALGVGQTKLTRTFESLNNLGRASFGATALNNLTGSIKTGGSKPNK